MDDINIFFVSLLSLLDEKMYVNEFLHDNVNVIAIQENIRKFLIENCQHDIVTDYIDITTEQTNKIVFCSKCNMTLER